MNEIIPYGCQNIGDEDISNVVEVLKDDFLTQGPKVEEFEKKFADYIGSKYAVAVSNGTAALHLSALSLGVKSGERVITSAEFPAALERARASVKPAIIELKTDPAAVSHRTPA